MMSSGCAHQAAADGEHLLLAARHGAGELRPCARRAAGTCANTSSHRLLRAGARARQHRAHLADSPAPSGWGTPGGLRRPGRCRGRRCACDSSAGDVALPLKRMRPDARLLDAGDGADQRGLAGAVGADDGDDLALRHLERYVARAPARRRRRDRGSRPQSIRPRSPRRDSTRAPPDRAPPPAGVPRAMTSPWCSTTDVLRERHHRAHHVLDQQDGEPFGAVEARGTPRPSGRTRSGRRPAITSSSSSSLGRVASARATSSRLRSGRVSEEAGRCAFESEVAAFSRMEARDAARRGDAALLVQRARR